MPIEDRSVLTEEEKQRRLQELMLELASKAQALPPGSPQNLISQRAEHIQGLAANGNLTAALKAAHQLVRAADQAAPPSAIVNATQRLALVPEEARTAVRVLELRVKDAKASGDAEAIRRSEAELKEALDLAEKGRTDDIARQAAADKINRLALERSAFGFDHLVISTEARHRQPAAV